MGMLHIYTTPSFYPCYTVRGQQMHKCTLVAYMRSVCLVLGEQLFVLVVTEKKTNSSPTQCHAPATLPPLWMGFFLNAYCLCHSFGHTVLSADVTRRYVLLL